MPGSCWGQRLVGRRSGTVVGMADVVGWDVGDGAGQSDRGVVGRREVEGRRQIAGDRAPPRRDVRLDEARIAGGRSAAR